MCTMKTLISVTTINPNEATHPKLALIAEGGGQRGIFTAGVLDDEKLQSKVLGGTDMDLRHDHRVGV
ncbi:MAG: hypothetical protein ACI9MS_001953 [Glaciecola sp.]|jgi:hypothetical protein